MNLFASEQRVFIPFGSQYYRAPTPKPDQWAADLENISSQGFNTIKIWAQWRWNNPAEGVYDFSDLKEIMDLAEKNNLRVVINAIYDVAPAWFWKKYPDSVMVCNNGRRLEPQATACRQVGGAPGPSYLHPEGIECRREFTSRLAGFFKDHPALYIWDLWNEPELNGFTAREPDLKNLIDYSEFAVEGFRRWLENRYGGVEALNSAWGRNYQNWQEVEVPRQGATFNDMIDWRMFFVEVIAEELRMRVEAIRSRDTNTPVMVHTVPMPHFNAVTCASDEYRLASLCDLFGNSVGSHPFAAAVTTSAAPGKTVINAEIHALSGNTYNCPPVVSLADMKRHILVPLARGIKGFLFWQYRPEILGSESPAWGLTDLEGRAARPLEHAVKINKAIQDHAGMIHRAEPGQAEVAVVNGTRNQVFDWCVGGDIDRHYKSVYGAFMALYHRQLNVDIVSTEYLQEQDISRYKAIYYPFPYYMEEQTAAALRRYVENGGMLISEAFFGSIRQSDGLHSYRVPGLGFDELFGVREEMRLSGSSAFDAYAPEDESAGGGLSLVSFRTEKSLPGLNSGHQAFGFHFAEWLQSEGAEVLGRFPDGHPAMTLHQWGKGQALMIGTLPAFVYGDQQDGATGDLLASLVRLAGVEPEVETEPAGVRADLLRTADGSALLVVMNESEEEEELQLRFEPGLVQGKSFQCLFTGNQFAIEKYKGTAALRLDLPKGDSGMYLLK
jgi:beta-galactosidase